MESFYNSTGGQTRKRRSLSHRIEKSSQDSPQRPSLPSSSTGSGGSLMHKGQHSPDSTSFQKHLRCFASWTPQTPTSLEKRRNNLYRPSGSTYFELPRCASAPPRRFCAIPAHPRNFFRWRVWALFGRFKQERACSVRRMPSQMATQVEGDRFRLPTGSTSCFVV